MNFANKTILITGCAGLLGSHLSRYLLNKGYKVVGVDDLSGGYEDFLPDHPNFKFYFLDLSVEKIDFIFKDEKIDAVFHFAAYAAEGLSPFIRMYNYTNNVVTSMNVINACVNYDAKMIFTSSMAVYGRTKPPFFEVQLPQPDDPYGIAKYAVELDIAQAHEHLGLRYSIVRPHNVVGIYQNIWDRYRNVIGIFIRNVLAGKPIVIFGDGRQTRAFSDIKFYMEPFERLIEEYDTHTFNIGADKVWSIEEVALMVNEVASSKGIRSANIQCAEPRHEVKHAYSDHTKAETLLGFKDETNLRDLIGEMFDWAQAQPERFIKVMDYEIEKGIYSTWK